MNCEELSGLLQTCGIVGAGGAGFPTYKKIDSRVETILLNCAECEPMLQLHKQLLEKKCGEILSALSFVKEVMGAREAVVGVKAEYRDTVSELNRNLPSFPGIRVHLLEGCYPMGDEVVLIYEATRKVVRPGGLPIEQGIAVFNVETMYNIHLALDGQEPVTQKLVTVTGAVKEPVTLQFPLGTSFTRCVEEAGGVTVDDPVLLIGGPMMGRLQPFDAVVTKTTNAVIVLPSTHPLIYRKRLNPSIGLKRAASVCCQCRACTDLCPRHALGHPVEPHRFMRAAAGRDTADVDAFINTMFCVSCGLCENFSCPQGLSPATLMMQCKNGLRQAGVRAPRVEAGPVEPQREYRKVPEVRLSARLGLSEYEAAAIWEQRPVKVSQVSIPLSQHIGAPAVCRVAVGDHVEKGMRIADPAQGLSVAIHASVTGTVTGIEDGKVTILTEDAGTRRIGYGGTR